MIKDLNILLQSQIIEVAHKDPHDVISNSDQQRARSCVRSDLRRPHTVVKSANVIIKYIFLSLVIKISQVMEIRPNIILYGVG